MKTLCIMALALSLAGSVAACSLGDRPFDTDTARSHGGGNHSTPGGSDAPGGAVGSEGGAGGMAANPEGAGGSGSTGAPGDVGENQGDMKIGIEAGGRRFTATLRDNAAAEAFMGLLPVTALMSDHNRNEKYYDLPEGLPASTYYPETIHRGDIMLFGARTLVLFYKTFQTSYGYTRIGSVDDPRGLEEALGPGSVTVRFTPVQP